MIEDVHQRSLWPTDLSQYLYLRLYGAYLEAGTDIASLQRSKSTGGVASLTDVRAVKYRSFKAYLT